MLQAPYSRYSRLFVYHLDLTGEPEVADRDFIGAWQEGETIVLFFHREKGALIDRICKQYGCSLVYQADLDYRDWEAGIDIAPFTVENLTIAPVWDPAPAQIKLDPSVIFGSGFHPTTRLCLQAMLTLMREAAPPIRSVHDLGCGTGVLSLAAARSGATEILAIDYNGLACRVADNNVGLNHCREVIHTRRMDLSADSPSTHGIDLVMANLHHELLLLLFQRPSFWQARFYILSGFFIHREEELLAALPSSGRVRFKARHSQSRWAIWVLERKKNVKNAKNAKNGDRSIFCQSKK